MLNDMPHHRIRSQTVAGALVAFSLALSAAVMFWQLPAPYWFDEANTLFYVRQPLARMLTYIANDFSPPAYYILLRAWVTLFGSSEAATGSLSLLATVATAVMTYRLGRRLFGPAVAGWGTALFWVSQAAIAYASETRMYALLMALTVASTLLLVRLLQQPQGWGVYLGYGVTVLLGVYTHYAFWFLVLAQNIAVALWLRRQSSPLRPRRWVAMQAAVVAAYLPQVPILADRVIHWYLAPGADWVDQVPADASLFWRLPLALLLPAAPDVLGWRTVAAVLAGAAAVLIFVAVRFDRSRREMLLELRPIDPGAMLLLTLTLIPLGVLYGLNVQFYRYAVNLAPLLGLLLAFGAATVAPRVMRTLLPMSLVLVMAGVNFRTVVSQPHASSAVWPAVAEFLHTQPASPHTIIAAHYDDGITLGAYYRGPLPIVRMVPLPGFIAGDRTVAEIRRIKKYTIQPETIFDLIPLLKPAREVWYVMGDGAAYYDPEHGVKALLGRLCNADRPLEFFADPYLQYGTIQAIHFYNCQYDLPSP